MDETGFQAQYAWLDHSEETYISIIPVQPGDKLSIEVENESGSADLTLQTESETLYDGQDIQNGSCTVEATAEGLVSITLDGNQACNGLVTVEPERAA